MAVTCRTAGLGDYKAHRDRLEEQPQLASLVVGERGIREDSSLVEYLMDVSHEGAAVPQFVSRLLELLYEASMDREVVPPQRAWGVYLPVRDCDVLLLQDEDSPVVQGEFVDALPQGVCESRQGSVEDIHRPQHLVPGAQDVPPVDSHDGPDSEVDVDERGAVQRIDGHAEVRRGVLESQHIRLLLGGDVPYQPGIPQLGDQQLISPDIHGSLLLTVYVGGVQGPLSGGESPPDSPGYLANAEYYLLYVLVLSSEVHL